jgi:plastocyanin
MAAPPAKTLRATGPAIIVLLIVAVSILGYFELVYYPTVAPTSTTIAVVPPTPLNVTVTIPSGASSTGKPTSFYYQPDSITVFIGYNSTVVWTNNDTGVTHTVTAALNAPDPRFLAFGPTAQPWNNILSGTSVNFTFTIAGTYNYSCSYHPFMHGQVIVKPAPSGLVTSTTESGSARTSSVATTSSSAAIISGVQVFGAAARAFASSFATLTGSGTPPWRVNLSSSFFAPAWLIPADLTKIL